MIVALITLLSFIILGGNYVVYKMVVYAFGLASYSGLIYIQILFSILAVSFVLTTLVTSKFFTNIGKIFYTGSAFWLGTLYWLFLATLIFGIIYGIILFVFPGTDMTILAKILIFIALGISVYGVWHSYQIKIKSVDVILNNLPISWENKKIVLFSDSHFGNVRNVDFAKKLVSVVNNQKPDVVLIAGDFFDGSSVNADQITDILKGIKSSYGIYFAPGNHEEYRDKKQFLTSLESSGVHVLNNEKETVNGLQLIGVNYSSTKNPEDQEKILDSLKIDPNMASILIKHEPANIGVAEKFSIGLQVSGHTHKGQVFPLNLLTKRVYGKFFYGLNRQEDTQVFTTSGVGTWGPPQRVGTNSEIVIITLKRLLK